MRSLLRSLVEHEAIQTTVAKAKELRPFAERMVTISKTDTVSARRHVQNQVVSAVAIKKLFTVIGPRYEKRDGGYTRIVRLGRVGKRVGEAARIEFVK